MNIILSGGWSYGNLGDEAILMTSIKLLHDKFPKHKIIVLVYKKNETSKYLNQLEYVSIEQSLHSLIFGIKDQNMDFGNGLLDELKTPIKRRLNNLLKPIKDNYDLYKFLKNPSKFIERYQDKIKCFSNLCKKSNLYVMSGGGYINNWTEMIISKYCEVYIAKENNVKTCMIGQTVGPFNKIAKQVYKLILSNIDHCFFRDIESINDTEKFGHNCLSEIIPDLALGEETIYKKENYIVFIPFLTDLNQHMDTIVENINAIVLESKCKVIITVSQQWAWCMQIATSFYISLKNKNINTNFIIPDDYKELEKILSSAQFVLSQNLHGLILAYRGHTPVVCLNNRRKFVSFMKAINQMQNLIPPSNITQRNLYECYIRRNEFDFSKCKEFQEQINNAINQTCF